ncbi:morphogenic membrane protein MmpB [Streptomyces sp. NPDC049813]
MLWSDPENEPPDELRETQEMLRRAGVVVALAMFLAMVMVGLAVL